MARRKKPTDPQDMASIAERRAERARNAQEINRLTKEDDVTVNVDARTGQLVGAWRRDVVSMMRDAGKITDEVAGYVRGLEGLIAEANGRSASCLSITYSSPAGAVLCSAERAKRVNGRKGRLSVMPFGFWRPLKKPFSHKGLRLAAPDSALCCVGGLTRTPSLCKIILIRGAPRDANTVCLCDWP
jgi:hypothetical protein